MIFLFWNIALINIIQKLLLYTISLSLLLRHNIQDLRKKKQIGSFKQIQSRWGKSLNNRETFFNEIDFLCNSVIN